MQRMKYVLLGMSFWVFLISASGAFAADLTPEQHCVIEKLVMARAVEDREPIDEGIEFDAELGKVYCWVKVKCPAPPTKIKHVWYCDDEKVFQLALEIKYTTMRTWSVKGIAPGNWRVDVVDKSDQVIGSVSFHVK